MTKPPLHEGAPETSAAPPESRIHLRPARAADIPQMVPVMLRLKRLNEEFDPLLKVRPDAEARAQEVLAAELENPHSVVLVAEGVHADAGKVVGLVRATVRERPFYSPEKEGVILDIYLLPLYRRHGVGEYLLDETVRQLKSKGVGIVTAEFPTQNEIANRFYLKRGYRPITALHARIL
jgi:ribosomal protein S18 acetylase RimI-like enzyme